MLFLTLLLGPAPYGIAINQQTKECGDYWGGDEFATYKISDDWEKNYPEIGDSLSIDGNTYVWDGDTEHFCKELGYTYIAGNIEKVRGHKVYTLYTVILFAFKVLPTVLIATLIILFVKAITSKPK